MGKPFRHPELLLVQPSSCWDCRWVWELKKEKDGKLVDFYFRQLWDGKGKITVEELGPSRLAAFAGLCGKTLAYAHARSGDAMMIRGWLHGDW